VIAGRGHSARQVGIGKRRRPAFFFGQLADKSYKSESIGRLGNSRNFDSVARPLRRFNLGCTIWGSNHDRGKLLHGRFSCRAFGCVHLVQLL
jgi:hypothetical protein